MIIKTFIVGIMAILLTSCGAGGNQGASSTTKITTQSFTVAGVVSKGPMTESVVTVYNFKSWLKSGGSLGKINPIGLNPVGSGVALKGIVTLSMKKSAKGATLLAISKGGFYTDEATGKNIRFNINQGFHAIILPFQKSVSITPLSELVFRSTVNSIKSGMPLRAAVLKARSFTTHFFGVHPTTIPDNPLNSKGSSVEAMKYAAILAGFSQMLQTPTITAIRSVKMSDFEIYSAVIDDLLDGTMDGQAKGTAIKIGKNAGFLPAYNSSISLSSIQTWLAAHPKFNPKNIPLTFKKPGAVQQSIKGKLGFVEVSASCNVLKCSNAAASTPLRIMAPKIVLYQPSLNDPKAFQLKFSVKGLFDLKITQQLLFANTYGSSISILASRFDFPTSAIWFSKQGEVATNGMIFDPVTRTITFSNTRLNYIPDTYPLLGAVTLNGTLTF